MGASASCTSTKPKSSLTMIDGYRSILERGGGNLLVRSESNDQVLAKLEQQQLVVLLAKSGQGKSTFVAQLVSNSLTNYDIVHVIFIGSVEGSTILFRLLTELVNELLLDLVKFDLHSNVYPLPNDRSSFPRDEMGIGGLFNVLLNKLTDSGKTVLICFDALNELKSKSARSLSFLPHRSKAKILLTTILDNKKSTSVQEVLFALERRFQLTTDSSNVVFLPVLDETEQHAMISTNNSTPLSKEVITSLQKKEGRTSPLYLRLVSSYLSELESVPGDIEGLYDWLLQKLLNVKKKDCNGLDIRQIMCSVAVSGGALFSQQLLAMQDKTTTLSSVGTIHFRQLLAHFLRATPVEDTSLLRISFIHMQADHCIRRTFLKEESKRKEAHQSILSYFIKQYNAGRHNIDELKEGNRQWRSILLGLPRHLMGSGDRDIAIKYMCNIKYCEQKLSCSLLSELIQDFRQADKKWSCSPFADFLELLSANSHVLRAHPNGLVQQALNSRDDSAARLSALALTHATTNRCSIRWENRSQLKPAQVLLIENQSVLFWCIDVSSVSSSGITYACGGSDACVHLLDEDGNETAVLPPHADDVDRIAFCPISDEYVVSSASATGRSGTEIFLNNTHTCTRSGTLLRSSHVYDLRWNDQGTQICAVESKGFVIIKVGSEGMNVILQWQQPEKEIEKEEAVIQDEDEEDEDEEEDDEEDDGYGPCHCCCFSPSPLTLIAVACGSFLNVINLENINDASNSGQAVVLDGRHEESIETIDWCKNNPDLIATGGLEGKIRLWSWKHKKVIRVINVHEDVIHCCRFSIDGKTLLSSSEDRTAAETLIDLNNSETRTDKETLIDLNNSETSSCCARLRGHSSGVKSILPINTEKYRTCITNGDDGTIRVWNLDRAQQEASSLSLSSKPITAAIWLRNHQNERIVVCGDSKGMLIATNNGSVLWNNFVSLSKHSHSAITDLHPANDRKIGAASMHLRVVTFSSQDGTILRKLDAEDWVNCCVLGQGIVLGGGDAPGIFVWREKEHFQLNSDKKDLGNTLSLTICPFDNTLLASGGNDRRLRLWRLGTNSGTQICSSCEMQGWIVSSAFCSKENVVIATAGKNGCISLLKVNKELNEITVCVSVLTNHSMAWCSVTKSGLIVCASGPTKLIHVWELASDNTSLVLGSLFPSKARFGSPDGIGGSGDIDGEDICIGDESGTLYILKCVVQIHE